MSDEANADAGAEVQPDGNAEAGQDSVSKAEFQRVIEQRQAEKAKRRDMAAKLAEYEAREKEAADAKLREQGEYEKLLEQERAEKLTFQQKLEAIERNNKFQNTSKAVAAKTGLDPVIVEALLLREEQVSGADVALDEVNDDAVVALSKALKKSAPSLFQTKAVGGSPTVPGLNLGNKAEGEDGTDAARARVRALAKAFSHKPKKD